MVSASFSNHLVNSKMLGTIFSTMAVYLYSRFAVSTTKTNFSDRTISKVNMSLWETNALDIRTPPPNSPYVVCFIKWMYFWSDLCIMCFCSRVTNDAREDEMDDNLGYVVFMVLWIAHGSGLMHIFLNCKPRFFLFGNITVAFYCLAFQAQCALAIFVASYCDFYHQRQKLQVRGKS